MIEIRTVFQHLAVSKKSILSFFFCILLFCFFSFSFSFFGCSKSDFFGVNGFRIS